MTSSRNQLGKYHLVAEIARGGMGLVYLAVARGPGGFNKLLVLKELQPQLVEDPGFLEMFFEEARLAARLTHPNIVQTYEVGSEENRHFIVMDYLSGRSLSRILRRKPDAFSRAMHLRICAEVLRGLDYAHNLTDYDGKPIGVVHRDVNPQNVFITFDGQVKLVDFGIAKALDSQLETRTGVLKGKPGYMAPEQLTGTVDTRADIFAVGTMIWEAIAGRRIWSGKTDLEILSQLMHRRIPSLAEVAPDAPAALVKVCERAMAADPEQRYQTAAELLADLEAYLIEAKEVVTVRDCAAVVTEVFAEEHAQTRSAIDKCMAGLKSGEVETSIPALPAVHEGTPSGPSPHRTIGPASHTPATPNGTTTPVALAPDARRAWTVVATLGAACVLGILWLSWPRAPESPAPGAAIEESARPTAPLAAPAPTAPAPAATASAATAATATAAAAPSTTAAPRTPPETRAVRTPRAAARPPPEPAPVPAAPASTCNPPFYFEGNKKVYKPGCI